MNKETKYKIPPKHLDSSDCVVHVGQTIKDGKIVDEGTAYNIHEGEWVKILPFVSMKESMALVNIANLDIENSGSDSMQNLREMCVALSKRVVDWNWTDNTGQPLDNPHNNADVFMGLQNEELIWLMTVSMGETPTEKKTDSLGSQNTSMTQVTEQQDRMKE